VISLISLQAKLLRFIQERTIERIGGRQEIPVDVRIICATHQNLEGLIEKAKFRQDLFYRISEITINIPPLREREGDAIIIATAFLKRFSKLNNKKLKGFTKEAALAIENYPWPGNVRELENKIKRAVIMSEGTNITFDDLDLGSATEALMPFSLKKVRETAETLAIQRALVYCDNNISQTAKLLGIARPTLYTLQARRYFSRKLKGGPTLFQRRKTNAAVTAFGCPHTSCSGLSPERRLRLAPDLSLRNDLTPLGRDLYFDSAVAGAPTLSKHSA
jgi:transcriptional regulator with PAS, ATPase and Fis domain